jgi:diaminohydroxyphosphoribosylaminopyrimidine deaminase/5-amino-6-(5-phosphoribosylamino)uracil reductase
MQATEDERYMQMALKLAARGTGAVEPNPAVGCVIVKANQIIGKGWHKKFGGPHAEINAIEDCRNIGAKPNGATMYVTLEPCCHYGKTGPCVEAIINAGIHRVMIATIDPSEYAHGRGINRLHEAGLQVEVGLCRTEAQLLNAGFLKFAKTTKPWVIVKWAQSIDGKLAWTCPAPDDGNWISNKLSRKDAHKLRRSVQGILVGINTVIADNPMLTPRPPRGKKPARIVLDAQLRIPLTSRLLRTAGSFPVIIATDAAVAEANQVKVERIKKKGARLIRVPAVEGKCNLEALLDELGKRGVAQLLVEGGAEVIASFLKAGFADAIRVYIAPKILGRTGAVGITESMAQLANAVNLHHITLEKFEGDVCISGLLKKLES